MNRHASCIAGFALLACLTLGLPFATIAASRSLSSPADPPDSTRVQRAKRTVALPVHLSVDLGVPLWQGEWMELRHDGTELAPGISVLMPTARRNLRTWLSVSYEQERIGGGVRLLMMSGAGSPYAYDRVRASLFTARLGADRTLGSEQRPDAYVGAGLGAGYGDYSAFSSQWGFVPNNPVHGGWAMYEGLARAGVYAYSSSSTRVGLQCQWSRSHRSASGGAIGVQQRVLFVLSVERSISIPRRLAVAG